ncbi:MAG TPA: recombinase family protein [Candidatus Fermentibacter daniensis]|nr:recombinase family protein [Candidatus Fermentibacter daniensis]
MRKRYPSKTAKKPVSGQRRAVIVARVSDPKQAKDGDSLEKQEPALIAFCITNQIVPFKVYRIPGESAFIPGPKLLEILEYIRCNRDGITDVLFWDLSRLFRNTSFHGQFREVSDSRGIRLHSLHEQLGDSAAERLMEDVVVAMNKFYSLDLSQKTTERMEVTRRKGVPTCRPLTGYLIARKPDGKRDDEKRWVLDSDRAPLLREAFTEFGTTGALQGEVLARMNRAGFRMIGSGEPMSPQCFDRLLGNPLYAGLILINEEEGYAEKCVYEPLISRDLHEKIERKLGRDPCRHVPHSRENPEYPLRGVLQCLECGATLTASKPRGKRKRYGYYALQKSKHRFGCRMGGFSLPLDKAHRSFEANLAQIASNQPVLDLFFEFVNGCWQDRSASRVADQKAGRARAAKLQEKRDALLLKYSEGKIDDEDYNRLSAKLKDEINTTLETVERLEELEVPTDDLLTRAQTTLEHLDDLWKASDPSGKTEMAKVLFPSGVACDKNGVVGTPQDAREIGLLDLLQGPKNEMAVPRGIEPRFDG